MMYILYVNSQCIDEDNGESMNGGCVADWMGWDGLGWREDLGNDSKFS
jgi:hypothetical protein